jgi:hypothetical protein
MCASASAPPAEWRQDYFQSDTHLGKVGSDVHGGMRFAARPEGVHHEVRGRTRVHGGHGPVKPESGAPASPETKQESAMKFVDQDEKFPYFRNYLSFDFGKLASNTDIINGMKKWGKMSGDDAREYLIPGSGPIIILVDDNSPLILKPIVDFPFQLNLSLAAVNNFESTAGKGPSAVYTTGNGKKLYRVGLTILELLIEGHLSYYHMFRDREDRIKVFVRLAGFEQDVYGGVITSEKRP